MKIVMSAFACRPHQGSEPGVGWNWVQQAAKHGHEVHVFTRENNRPHIEMELRLNPVPGLHFHYLDLPTRLREFAERHEHYSWMFYAYSWQIALFFGARRLHKQINFDLAHHVTYCNDWLPSGLSGLNIPFIWGPVGGSTHTFPKAIELNLPAYAKKYEMRRFWTQRLLLSLDPLLRLTRRRADVILTYTEEALAGIPPRLRKKARSVIHIGMTDGDLPVGYSRARDFAPDEEFTILTGGRLVHWKGFDLLVEAFSQHVHHTQHQSKLIITGKGPYQSVLETIVQHNGVEDRVKFVGHLPTRDDLFQLMLQCDLYALPTLRDGPPVAILEAMFAGMPILCLDIGATHEMVPDQAGLKIPVKNRAQVVQDIATALMWGSTHRRELQQMGQLGRGYGAATHNWNRIGEQIHALYEELATYRKA